MDSKNFLQALLCLCCMTSCVDSKYDLSDVDTDDLVVGDEWVAPLGTGSVTVEDVIKVYKVPAIQVDPDGGYVARYTGTLTPLKSDLRGGETTLLASANVSFGNMGELFDEDFTLNLADPHLMLRSGLTKGSIDCRLDIVGSKIQAITYFPLSVSAPNVWIGPDAKSVTSGYAFYQNTDLPKVIAEVPKNVDLYLWGNSLQLSQLGAGSLSNIGYTLEVPLAPAPGFRGVTVEQVKDAFDETFVDYIFSGGSAAIYGTVKNEMPFDLTIEMIVTDQNGKDLGLKIPAQAVKGASGEVKFEFTEQDMPKMVNARNLDFKMYLTGREQPEILKKDQKISLNLKLQKKGGISI